MGLLSVTSSVLCLLLLLYVVVTSADVCQDCKCQREEGSGGSQHFDIRCDCDGEILQDLTFTREYMKFREDPSLTVALSVSGCRHVLFDTGLLLTATRVAVRNVSYLTVEHDSLLAVGDLEVRQVDSLLVASWAFFRRNVTSLLVEDSFVKSVGVLALVSVNDLRSLRLNRVTVERLETSALILNVSEVILCDTAILRVKRHGFLLKADNLTVVDSSFGFVEDEGMNITSPLMRLTNNTFRNLEGPRSLCLHGGQAQVTGNRFPSFPGCLMEEDNLQSLDFVGNDFQFRISDLSMDTLANVAEKYGRNGFQCDCSDDFGRSVSLLNDTGYGPLLEKIFCVSPLCPLSVTHGELLRQFQGNWSECALEDTKCVSSAFSIPQFPSVTVLLVLLHAAAFY